MNLTDILEGVLAALVALDILTRLFLPTPFWSRYELKSVIREVLTEYGVAKDPSRALIDSITAARSRAGQKPLPGDSSE